MAMSGPIVAICGTRPELIKTAPVLREFQQAGVSNELILTGQHKELVSGLCQFFEIEKFSELDCSRAGSNLNILLSSLLVDLNSKLTELEPKFILVQGDTTSALAGALAGFHLGVPIGHIEAGLRTGDLHSPYPEEANRRLISQIATLHFTPTPGATNNLMSEGVDASRIFEVGNTIVDATKFAVNQAADFSPHPIQAPYVVVTVHRRESWETDINAILDALKVLASQPDFPLIKFVMHANPELQSRIRMELESLQGIELLAPLQYPEFVSLICHAHMILSDSGGIQEEAPTLGIPTVVLRGKTERPEAVEVGACRIAGTQTESIVRVVKGWHVELENGDWAPASVNPFGDGKSADRIVEAVMNLNLDADPTFSEHE
jgi:UDP-N-acetylglucosamine 2-epimerase (non-hydrolysing)